MLPYQRIGSDHNHHIEIINQGNLLASVPPGEPPASITGLRRPPLIPVGHVLEVAADVERPSLSGIDLM